MRREVSRWLRTPKSLGHQTRGPFLCRWYSDHKISKLVQLDSATFYRNYPSTAIEEADPIFKNASFSVSRSLNDEPVGNSKPRWAVVSPTSLSGTSFLEILGGKHVCIPPSARTYPFLAESSRTVSKAIQYVGFDAQRGAGIGGSDMRGAYLSARYESRKEEVDFTLLQYLTGQTQLNAEKHVESQSERQILENVTEQLKLIDLLDLPVANLSNGQTRRARIARALMSQPDLLLLDGPFMGLDPMSRRTISNLLKSMSDTGEREIILNLRLGEELPDWISHVLLLGHGAEIIAKGPLKDLQSQMSKLVQEERSQSTSGITRDGHLRIVIRPKKGEKARYRLESSRPLIEMKGVKVSYGTQIVLGDWEQRVDKEKKPGLWWKLSRGQRWAVFGPNGSGKTTLLSLITSDHPQSYSLPIDFFGKSRLPEPGQPGISLFDVQKRIGHSSPEIHAFFPKTLTIRRVLESAWAEAPLSRPILTSAADRRVDAYLRWFARELRPTPPPSSGSDNINDNNEPTKSTLTPLEEFLENYTYTSRTEARRPLYAQLILDESDLDWADTTTFAQLSFSNQRLLLFLRAMVSQPDILILDEALSGVDEATHDKALLFLSWGETRTFHPDGDRLRKTPQALLDAAVEQGLSVNQALVVISHDQNDVPGCVRDWICLPEAGSGEKLRMGRLDRPLDGNSWKKIWDVEAKRGIQGKKSESKKSESKKRGRKKGESKKSENKKSESKKGESKKGESKKSESKKSESKKSESKESVSKESVSKESVR